MGLLLQELENQCQRPIVGHFILKKSNRACDFKNTTCLSMSISLNNFADSRASEIRELLKVVHILIGYSKTEFKLS